MADDIKEKMKNKSNHSKNDNDSEENVYKYTVDFEEVEENNEEESDKQS